MLEYGVDAYDMVRRAENEELQAEWTRRLARELEANAATCEVIINLNPDPDPNPP